MTTKQTSQAQQKKTPADTFADFVTPGIDNWRNLVATSMERFEGYWEELAKVEQQAAERTNEAIDQSAELMRESIAYGRRLGDEWRKLARDAFKRASA